MNQESGKKGGFFSKMLQKVRGSPAGWSADPAADDAQAPYTQEALNQMLERKRRDDAIRVQEFAELRQLRSKGSERAGQPVVAPASAFLPSALESEGRAATTLQKINDIEAQMAQQWWRNASDGASAAVAERAPTVAAASSDAAVASSPLTAAPMHAGMSAAQWQSIPTLGQESVVDAAPELPSSDAALVTTPDIEEAAILFAHGDVDGAKARLLELLVHELDRKPVDNTAVAGVWHTVLDLYRAIGDEEGFEPLAIDYAAHFDRSPPLWFSIPEQLGLPALGEADLKPARRRPFRWNAPGQLSAEAVAALENMQAMADAPWRISWGALGQIEAAAVPHLARLIEQWASMPGQFVVGEAERLLALVEAQAISGDAARPAHWWALRMAVLRWLNRLEAFEQVALDYCVTYEVSPPSWVPPQCVCDESEQGGQTTMFQPSSHDSRLSSFGPSSQWGASTGGGSSPLKPEDWPGLAGVIEGDAMPWLRHVQAGANLGEWLDILCDHLIRLDFVAAGTVLNWAAEMQTLGHRLRFSQLHHLVGVFFHVIGIQAHATLQLRKA